MQTEVNAPLTNQTALDRLCALCGIASKYLDASKSLHIASSETKLALLAAMGVVTEGGGNVERVLEEIELRIWQRVLPPVLVVQIDETIDALPVTLPTDVAGRLFNWVLTHEDGTRREGKFRPADFPVIGERRMGGIVFRRFAVHLFPTPDMGYHRLDIHPMGRGSASSATLQLIVAPAACYQPPALAEPARVWGTTVQLYGLRSQRNWGIGDFTDLKMLVQFAAEVGASVVGVSPLHAMFPSSPKHISPYGPSNRSYFNILYLDIEAIPDFAECEAARQAVDDSQFQARLRALRATELVDYAAVAAAKLSILELTYQHFCKRHAGTGSERDRAFQDFRKTEGRPLRLHALFDALDQHFQHEDSSARSWRDWPEDYRDSASPAVVEFAVAHAERVEFYEYLQWQAACQLGNVEQRCRDLRLGIGLYLDLAVGMDPAGSEAWVNNEFCAIAATIGAPPDEFNLRGQDWRQPPLVPQRFVEAAYGPFIAALQKNMRHAGALRISHVASLARLFWVPRGSVPTEGSYVCYPFQDLLRILALESVRHKCLVIGDMLGTIPKTVAESLRSAGVLETQLFYFDQDPDNPFKPPAEYPAQAVIQVSSHDLPTLAGYWLGQDLDVRQKLGLFPSDDMREERIVARAKNRARLLVALEREALLPPDTNIHAVSFPAMIDTLVRAAHRYVARTPAKIMMVQPADVLGQIEQMNIPGTGDEYPNWRLKLPLNLEEWSQDQRVRALVDVLQIERQHSIASGPAPAASSIRAPARIPRATYRLQFNRNFTFAEAADLVPYLHALGVSHCYASPYLKARPGSMHGYDIIDHNVLNPEVGSAEDFEKFAGTLERYGMGQILDIVPNHMGVMGSDNEWWLDVLENGQASIYAEFFDIDWEPPKQELRDKVLVPVLGDQYGKVLEKGELKLVFNIERGEFSVWYYEHRFPVDPREYPQIIGYRIERLAARLGADDPQLLEFQSLVTALGHLPARDGMSSEQRAERNRDKEVHKRHLSALCKRSDDIAMFIEENIVEINGNPGDPKSFDLLHNLIKAQAVRLAYWRVAADDINYRRFFDINDLAALRMERDEVFAATHRLILDLIAKGKLDGLRIDHPDGLYDPLQYCQRLNSLPFKGRVGEGMVSGEGPASNRDVYLVVEKIIASYEHLPKQWPVEGTTGYRFANVVNGLFVNTANEQRFDRVYGDFIGQRIDYGDLLYRCKKLIMRMSLASQLNVLANKLSRIALLDRHTCDFTVNRLRDALMEVTACFPVYRTYITQTQVSEDDKRFIDWAVSAARKKSHVEDISVFDFVRATLLTSIADGKGQGYRDAVIDFAMRYQQFSGPVTAKAVEDTSFYIYNRLTSLNEVGGDPGTFGMTLNAFHGASQDRAKNWPNTMLATSTHDGKRSEDVRARINVLSELPALWRTRLYRWSRLNRRKKTVLDGEDAPSRNDEYLLYQTLIGAWPLEPLDDAGLTVFAERIEGYLLKAIREAKVHTSWLNVNVEYENAISTFVRALLAPGEKNIFLADFLPFQRIVSRLGMFNSLSQILIKLTSPGVPDIYQGNELWEFSLVDPDNRRPVDYRRRRTMLDELKTLVAADSPTLTERVSELLRTMEDGRIKLYLTWKILEVRSRLEPLFRKGDYIPLRSEGSRAEHICAYARVSDGRAVVTVAPRLFYPLAGESGRLPTGAEVWEDTRMELPSVLARGGWINALTGETIDSRVEAGRSIVPLAELFANFPYALLTSELSGSLGFGAESDRIGISAPEG